MAHLRPVTEYLKKASTGTIHVINMRDYHGDFEKSACGEMSDSFQQCNKKITEVDLDNPSLCNRCKNIHFDQ